MPVRLARRAGAPTRTWGAWAAPSLALALRRLRRAFPFDLVHAHNAVPAGDAVLRARGPRAPLVVSVHGGDVLLHRRALPGGARRRARARFAPRALVLANSAGIARAAREPRARARRASCTSAPTCRRRRAAAPRGDADARDRRPPGRAQAPRRRAARAVVLRDRPPDAALRVIGDGPERGGARAARRSASGSPSASSSSASSPPSEALARARTRTLFVMPSTDEAFGVAYVEAMAGGVPAIGCRGEPGPEEIAAAGDGFVLVPPGDIERWPRGSTSCFATRDGCARLGAARARDGRARTSPGSAAARRRSPPTSRRCG